MNEQRRPSSPRSSTSSRPPRGLIAQYISDEIKSAIKPTTAGIPENLVQILRFLPKGDLQTILNINILKSYLWELFGDTLDTRNALEGGILNEGLHEPASIDKLIDNALTLITGNSARSIPPRRALLALFLYQRHAGLLPIFKSWLLSQRADFPSDNDFPFTPQSLEEAGIPDQYHDYFNDYQSIFMPVVLKKGQNQKFTSKDRLPYIGVHLTKQEGSSGIVYTRKVAPYHWQVRLPNGVYIPAETESPTILALKVFNGGRSEQEARADFEIERRILQDLRESNYAHKMILLDWGSITIQDEHGPPIAHSLIFECAMCSLQELLMGEKGLELACTADLLLAKLADIVQALACLHDNFDTLHLDIKPENILVFENASADDPGFEWKITDFGLARKHNAQPRAGHLLDFNQSISRSGSLFATRNAGRYQAPEIQQRNASKAGRKSDVWSMGCVALMVLGFAIDGSERVIDLTNCLRVEYQNGAGVDSSFYVTSDSYEWRYVDDWPHYNYDYFQGHKPAPGAVPGMGHLKAAVHPKVVEWSNALHRYCNDKPEQPIMGSLLETIFRGVLLIDMGKRIKAVQFYKYLVKIKEAWKLMEESTEDSIETEIVASKPVDKIAQQQPRVVKNEAHDPQRHPVSAVSINGSPEHQLPEPHIINEGIAFQLPIGNVAPHPDARSHEAVVPQQPVLGMGGTPGDMTEDAGNVEADIIQVPDSSKHSKLCVAIMEMASVSPAERLGLKREIQKEVHRDPKLIRTPCPRFNCQRHPIHVAIRNKSYEALEALLGEADLSVLDIRCPGCGNRTAVEEACESVGDLKVLNLFERHVSDFGVTKDFCDFYKNRVGRWVGEKLKDLSRTSPKESFLHRIRTGQTSRSA